MNCPDTMGSYVFPGAPFGTKIPSFDEHIFSKGLKPPTRCYSPHKNWVGNFIPYIQQLINQVFFALLIWKQKRWKNGSSAFAWIFLRRGFAPPGTCLSPLQYRAGQNNNELNNVNESCGAMNPMAKPWNPQVGWVGWVGWSPFSCRQKLWGRL